MRTFLWTGLNAYNYMYILGKCIFHAALLTYNAVYMLYFVCMHRTNETPLFTS